MPPKRTSATPAAGRVTRARSNTPLPALDIRQSHAYGARGKTNLNAQMQSQTTNFDDMFEANRAVNTRGSKVRSLVEQPEEEAAEEDEDVEEDLPRETQLPKGRSRKSQPREPDPVYAPESDEDDAGIVNAAGRGKAKLRMPPGSAARLSTDVDRTGTLVEDGVPYAGTNIVHRAVNNIPLRNIQARERDGLVRSEQVRQREFLEGNGQAERRRNDQNGDKHNPNAMKIFGRTLPLFVPIMLRNADPSVKFVLITLAFLSGMLSALWIAVGPVPTILEPRRTTFTKGIKAAFGWSPFDRAPEEWEKRWNHYVHDEVYSRILPAHNVPEMQWQINMHTLSRLDKIEKNLKALELNLKLHNDTLQRLEQTLPAFAVLHSSNGELEIPQQFWSALRARLTSEGEAAPLWRSFLAHNEKEIERLHAQAASEEIDRAVENKYIVSQATLIDMLKRSNDELAFKHEEDFRQLWHQNLDAAKEVALKVSSEALAKNPATSFTTQQLQVMTAAVEIYANNEKIHSVNFFSLGQGARVNPHLTSPTYSNLNKSWLTWAYSKVDPLLTPPHGPTEALTRWEEATDCWCAAPSEDGHAQLTVEMAHKIYPSRLVIEHVPIDGTLNIKAAPHHVEMWAGTASAAEAHRLNKIIAEMAPGDDTYECGKAPSDNFVCIGQADYDIHSTAWVQGFPIYLPMEDMAFAVNKVSLRVTSNWGASYTCLYRVRLTGDPVFVNN